MTGVVAQPRHQSRIPACHDDAAQRLTDAEIPFSEIVRVNPDAILFLNVAGCPVIGWMRAGDGRDEIVLELGFPAEPSAWVPALAGEGWTSG